ncbi:hypothetical protein L873DRAFT_443815 [Choiromyces venosus 120613-1]|uniref:Uncharacterized protein n=1 Tax=Choiromyces venosus 120613-1 TaxID=1336337 RepID=A0A3N4IVW9_9PEZI|nr:hypothetical protein L873DRAFT_443815 [Choiromyces venosus 120613-1]
MVATIATVLIISLIGFSSHFLCSTWMIDPSNSTKKTPLLSSSSSSSSSTCT